MSEENWPHSRTSKDRFCSGRSVSHLATPQNVAKLKNRMVSAQNPQKGGGHETRRASEARMGEQSGGPPEALTIIPVSGLTNANFSWGRDQKLHQHIWRSLRICEGAPYQSHANQEFLKELGQIPPEKPSKFFGTLSARNAFENEMKLGKFFGTLSARNAFGSYKHSQTVNNRRE